MTLPKALDSFIFFQEECPSGGSGNPVIFIGRREERKAKKVIRKKLKIIKKKKKVSQEVIDEIAESMLRTWNPEPAIQKYELEYEEALARYRLYIEIYIQFIEDEEIALLLIFANI